MNQEVIRVLLVDDHPAIREGLVALIDKQKDIRVCWQAENGEEALSMFRLHQPNIVLMDLRMPVMNGVQATRLICTEFPTACILALTAGASTEEINGILQAGAKACLFKDGEAAAILNAIRDPFSIPHEKQCHTQQFA